METCARDDYGIINQDFYTALDLSNINWRDCTLPCRFKKSGEAQVIQWVKWEKNVHSFYEKKDHLEHQDQDYKGRTALFKDQIHSGNASLLLREVNLQDKGTYTCYARYDSDGDNNFVAVTVKAPVTSVDIKETDDEVTCSSSGVYPAPSVSWLTDPSSSQDILKVTKNNSVDQQGLYSVKSTLKKIPGNSTAYICSATSGSQKWIASLRNEVEKNINETQTLSIQCPVHQSDSQDFSITWTFNSTTTIVIYDSQTQELKKSDQWKNVVKTVTGEGTLQLQNLRSTEHSGTYTCDRTADNSRDIVHTCVHITPSQDKDQLEHQDQDYKGRTALFKDQIHSGNASLLLREVNLQDKGTYTCYARYDSDGDNNFVAVTVKGCLNIHVLIMIMESLIRISTLLWILVVLTEGDIHINCIYSEGCILPCHFKEIVGGEVLHWIKDRKTIHSFYEGQDQLGHQDKDYEGRTALFKDQIHSGNASLLIKPVELQDDGRYKCYTSNDKGNEESYVLVAVKAPVKSLNITETDDEVMCTSGEVYPAPTVSWSTVPSSDQENLKMTTEIPEDQQGLFSVKSTLKKIPDNSTTYICSITSSGMSL
ncbi:uncharacterized protein LOC115806701 [Chanos chanos]|uniref:Uncharacterized protein LOC115806701 n=1 Tax=Chanos chanos TaxID=29144 RepID=A0A6J2UWH2_CHACN|nr:uncharacterized protein LOC115806701 [Chanos chanos]